MAKNRFLTGGLFDGRGKPQPLKESAKSKHIVPLEKYVQISFIGWRDTFKGRYPILNSIFAVPNGLLAKNAAAARSMVAQGMTAGIHDVICLAPSADGKHHGLLIEFKTEDEKRSVRSVQQEFFHDFFSKLGFRSELCRTWWDAAKIVNDHLGLTVPVYGRENTK